MARAKERAMRHYRVRDVMSADPTTVTPATPLKNVAEMLVKEQIGVVPVLTPQGRVAGVVAEGGLLRKERLQRDPDGLHSVHLPYRTRRDIATAETAGELMDRYPPTVPAGTSVAEVARLMDRHRSRFLLVTGEDGKLLGVVTARDLLLVFPAPKASRSAPEVSLKVIPLRDFGLYATRIFPRCALTTEKDPGQTRRNGDPAPLTTQSESARSGGGILLGSMSRTGRDEAE